MRTIILQNGISSLVAQSAAGSGLLTFKGFVLGDALATQAQIEAWDDAEPSLTMMQGNVVLTSDASAMRYSSIDDEQAVITCLVSEDVAQIPIGNVTLLASLGTSPGTPFTYSATADNFIKLSTDTGSPGYAWWFHLILQIPNLRTRFDLSNLPEKTVDWLTEPTEWDLPPAYTTEADQLIITAHSQDGRPHPVFNIDNRLFGAPFDYPLDGTTTQLSLSGGTMGDNYTGV